jgi:hypothetical protein
MVFFKTKVIICILIHPISNYMFWGELLKNTPFYLYCIISLYPKYPIDLILPNFSSSRSPIVVHFFLHLFFFDSVSHIFFPKGQFSLYNQELWNLVTMLKLHELNQNNKPEAKACNSSIVLHCEMKFKYNIEVNKCLGTKCSLCL